MVILESVSDWEITLMHCNATIASSMTMIHHLWHYGMSHYRPYFILEVDIIVMILSLYDILSIVIVSLIYGGNIDHQFIDTNFSCTNTLLLAIQVILSGRKDLLHYSRCGIGFKLFFLAWAA